MLRSLRLPRPFIRFASMPLGSHETMPVRRWPERRPVVLRTAAVLFAGIFALRLASADVDAGIALLLVVPTALVALELGLAAGVGAAALAFGLVLAWSSASGTDLGAEGLVTRTVVFVFVGALAGRFSDRMREAAVRQQGLMTSGLALAHLHDAGELPLVVARQARTIVDARGARVSLGSDQVAQDGELGAHPVHIPIELRGERIGDLAIEPSGQLAAEDEAALATLATQAAVAIDNQRLLLDARDRAALEAQLGEARERLSVRSDQLREVLGGQEDERRELALRLHEDTAQAVAAILLGLGALQRDPGSEAVQPSLERLRSNVEATLGDLRGLAVSLRPPVLDLGLAVALQRLGDQHRSRGLARMDLALNDALDDLDGADETALYRVVEDALDAYDRLDRVEIVTAGDELVVTVQGAEGDRLRPERVVTVGARVDLLGGTLHADGGLRAHIPLGHRRAA